MRQTGKIGHENIWTWLREWNHKRKKLISFHSNTKQCHEDHLYQILCGETDETVDHVISECSNLGEKKQDWLGKGVHWELRKKLKLGHTTKRYMHKPESILENRDTKKVT